MSNATTKLQFYSFSRDSEFDRHETLDEAKRIAAASLDGAREGAQIEGGWPCDVDDIEYGIVLPIAKAEGATCDMWTDYKLQPTDTTDAAMRIVELERQCTELRLAIDSALHGINPDSHAADTLRKTLYGQG